MPEGINQCCNSLINSTDKRPSYLHHAEVLDYSICWNENYMFMLNKPYSVENGKKEEKSQQYCIYQIIIGLLQKKAKNIQTHFMQGTSFQWTASIYTYLGMAQLLPLFLEGPHFPVGPPWWVIVPGQTSGMEEDILAVFMVSYLHTTDKNRHS